MSVSDVNINRHNRILGNKANSNSYPQCKADKREQQCFFENARHAIFAQPDNTTRQHGTHQTQAIAAGTFNRGECTECPANTFASVPKVDPMSTFSYAGNGPLKVGGYPYTNDAKPL